MPPANHRIFLGIIILLLLVIAGAQLVSLKHQSQSVPAPRWQYAVLKWKPTEYDWQHSTATRTAIRFDDTPENDTNVTSYATIDIALDDLGRRGWEATFTTESGIILKRRAGQYVGGNFTVYSVTEKIGNR